MEENSIWLALLIGALEGFTEFLPVSSTGHILLAGHFLGFESKGKAFEVLIQLGAILAVVIVYFRKLSQIVLDALKGSKESWFFAFGVLLAFFPAAFIGVLGHPIIKGLFFESPALICTTLIIGGILLYIVDRLPLTPKYNDATKFPLRVYFIIGCFQVLALIPGTSRSGATIAGALLYGVEKRAAAEFTFFLAIPTMTGAFAYDLYKNWDILETSDMGIIAVGFFAAFIMGLFVVTYLLDYVSRHGFSVFAYWRILVGTLGLVGLYFVG